MKGVSRTNAIRQPFTRPGRRGSRLAFAEFNAPVRDLLDRAGLLAAVGPDMIFDDLDDALRAFEATKGGPP